MNDLGYIPPAPKQNLGATPVTIVSEHDVDRKPQYPRLEFNGEQAAAAGLNKCSIGDVYEITIRLRAKRLGNYGWDGSTDDRPSAEFEVISADSPTEVEEEEEEPKPAPKAQKPEKPLPKRRTLSPKDAGLDSDEEDDD